MIFEAIQQLLNYAVKNELITSEDEIVARNGILDVLGLNDWQTPEIAEGDRSIDDILNEITDYACENGVIEDTAVYRDLFDTRVMGVLTPMPHEVNKTFREKYNVSPKCASDWYYSFSQKLNYVRKGRIEKDLKWTYESEYGVLDITINRSKPEKDSRDIAAARNAPAAKYPKCQLCAENAGFAGTLTHPARQNLRPIPITVNGGNWYLQYSPYGYYNEHCIVFNENHIPMTIDASVFEKLFDILDLLPHYFVGSNADLPIVGGSILSHEHFQGGNYTFAMERAPVEYEFNMSGFPKVSAGIVRWPMSVIRLSSADRQQLSKACDHVLKLWRGYSDETVGVYAATDDTPHNTVTPISRKRGDSYECDLVLRNNLTTDERPMGVFHPNESLHHIKKENIGLIEVMGLAVLPSRLATELDTLKDAMLSGDDIASNPEISSHAVWAAEVKLKHPEFSKDNAEEILRSEVGAVFEQVLLDAGVFKRNEQGKNAFLKFVEKCQA
ncbi:MAG: UDP-glucose--hexose-1-phosphate uridylyltransferase [Ruminococcus sp.]|nr:UDP-glucose--hexose-1-phosphate uridylyltransferase [Ruminococcus sp.]